MPARGALPDDSKMKMSRRSLLQSFGGLALAGVGLEGLVFEPRRLEVTRHRLGGEGSAVQVMLRLVQLTDLHLRRLGETELAVVETISALCPDLVVLTGDAIDSASGLETLEKFLHLFAPQTPKYAILGNWEYAGGVDLARLRTVYEAANCRLLVNESSLHLHGGASLLVTGMDDLIEGHPDPGAALGRAPAAVNHLLLAHCPAHRDEPEFKRHLRARPGPSDSIRYMLAGHTHGGQIALGGVAPLLPEGSGGYVSGWYRGEGAALYVSRGVGWSGIPIRLGAAPEIAVFDWELGVG